MTEAQLKETQEILDVIKERCHHPVLIGYGGSIAYGTSTDDSDVDIRGIYLNPIDEFIGTKPDSEQFMMSEYDTTIYSIKKMFYLMANCNPNTIELLGLKDEHYLFSTIIGKMVRANSYLFLSKKAGYTFGRYANSQLNRLMNKSGRAVEEVSNNEVRSINKALVSLKRDHDIGGASALGSDDGSVRISIHGDYEINQATRLFGEITNIHSDYKKSVRNDKAMAHNKITKHMMHLVRLYLMGIDILDKHEIITYRPEHDLLMAIRNGEYMEADGATPTKEFNQLVEDLNKQFDEAWEKTTLPEKPDAEEISKLMMRCVRVGHHLH